MAERNIMRQEYHMIMSSASCDHEQALLLYFRQCRIIPGHALNDGITGANGEGR